MWLRGATVQRGQGPLTQYVFDSKQAGESSEEVAPTLRSMNYAGSRINGGGQLAVTEVRVSDVIPFDPVQVTHPANRSRFEPGPSPALTGDSRTPTILRVAPQFDGTGVADPITANEARTWTQEGNMFRLRNVVGDAPGAWAFKPSHFTRGKDGAPSEIHPPLSADADKGDQDPVVYTANEEEEDWLVLAPRRLTPTECARLQGFPDDWLDIEGASDSAKYRALGNAVAVPCVAWIAARLVAADKG